MDNFIDKLAQRYNATEMIRANSQADTAQMEGLQEQVEAYEAVLQEMRKLNYKNTELTEKMYSLVDESLAKVRTLQIEASEGGANPAEISREMSAAVINAVNEAFNNADSTVAKTISESLSTALAQPAEEIKQSAIATESVKEVIEGVDGKVSLLMEQQKSNNEALEVIARKLEEQAVVIAENEAKRQKDRQDDMEALLEAQMEAEIRAEESAKKETASQEESNSEKAEEAPAVTGVDEALIKDNHEELVRLVENLGSDVFNVNAKLTGIEDMISADSGRISAISQAVENSSNNSADDQAEYIDAKLEAVSTVVAGTSSKLDAISLASEAVDTKISQVSDKISEASEKIDSTESKLSMVAEMVASLDAKIEEINSKTVEEPAKDITEETTEEPTIDATKEAVDAVAGKVEACSEKLQSTDTYVRGIWESVESQKNALSSISQQIGEAASNSKESPELRSAVMDIVGSVDEIKAEIRGVKTSQDGAGTVFKSTIDSAIYGLKQDNREIVEFMQRMNANLVAANSDEDKELKEAEKAKEREEEKKIMDERFKSSEDFVHKESVKVYRNVQAVVNEKSDKMSDTFETKIKQVNAQVSSLKILVIIAAILSGADLVVQVLRIFGIL